MLNSDDRRPAFDRWFNALDQTDQASVTFAALAQRESLQESDGTRERPVSVIDALENIWDHALDVGVVEATKWYI